jgi:HEAT repeat protein
VDLVLAATLAMAMAGGPGGPGAHEFRADSRKVRSEAVELLVRQLADPEKGRSAARRLVRFGRSAVPALRGALSDEDLQVRFYAATALSLMTDPEATRILVGVLADEKEPPLIRRIAASAMYRAGCRESVPVLVRLARRTYAPDPGTGAAGDDAVRRAHDKGPDRDADPLDDPMAGPSGEPFRYEVVKALAYVGSADADAVIIAALADPSPRIRKAAAQGLGDHRVVTAVPALEAALRDPEADVVAEAARAFGKFGRLAGPATEELVGLLEHDDARVRAAARGALTLATGYSFSTPERWREWWERRKKRLAAHEEAPWGARAGDAEDDEASHGLEWPVDEGLDGESDEEPGEPGPASSLRPTAEAEPGGTPPALQMPWEQDEEDWSETPEP